MENRISNSVVLLSAVLAAALGPQLYFAPDARAAEARSLPTFEVDPGWPKVPPVESRAAVRAFSWAGFGFVGRGRGRSLDDSAVIGAGKSPAQ